MDCNSVHVAQIPRKRGIFWGKIRFATAPDLIKCLKQIKKRILLLTCASITKLPPNISTMISVEKLWHVNYKEYILRLKCLTYKLIKVSVVTLK